MSLPSSESTPELLSAPQWLYQTLRDQIIRGELAPGSALRQQHLAESFGLSAIPVREALRMLEADRFVTIRANRGAVVRRVSLVDALEVVELRLLLEPAAIAMATPNMKSQDLAASAAILTRYTAVDDVQEWASLNRQFHFSLYGCCGSPRLIGLIENLFDDVLRFAHVRISVAQGNKRAHREHKSILAACRRGEAEIAAERLRNHIERSKQSLESLIGTAESGD
ncbi:MAG: transcriptional regulator [Thiotrichales bacterium]|nr:transcriptional regulator [Thiotrichales bacterium]